MDNPNSTITEDKQTPQPTKIGQWIIEPSPDNTGGLMLSGFSMSQDIPLLEEMKIGAVLSIVVQNELERNSYD